MGLMAGGSRSRGMAGLGSGVQQVSIRRWVREASPVRCVKVGEAVSTAGQRVGGQGARGVSVGGWQAGGQGAHRWVGGEQGEVCVCGWVGLAISRAGPLVCLLRSLLGSLICSFCPFFLG